jgi:hypothetical protein
MLLPYALKRIPQEFAEREWLDCCPYKIAAISVVHKSPQPARMKSSVVLGCHFLRLSGSMDANCATLKRDRDNRSSSDSVLLKGDSTLPSDVHPRLNVG